MDGVALERVQSAVGLVVIAGFAWAISENRGQARLRVAVVGIALQLSIAALLFYVPGSRTIFTAVNDAVLAISEATRAGTSFVFGYVGGGKLPFAEDSPGGSFILAFQALPLILVVSALTALLTYWRILPIVVRAFAFVLQKTLGVGGAAGLGTAANIFVGMIEAPLFVRPYLMQLSRSELFVLMASGMATIAGTVMVLYSVILATSVPDAAGNLLMASIISAPAAVTIALLMVPSDGRETAGDEAPPITANSTMDAITTGTVQGLSLLLNVIAMLIVLVALVHLANALLGLLPEVMGGPLTWQRLFGWVMAPLCWLMGIPWAEATTAGSLMGIKTVLNELLAYLAMTKLPPDALSQRSELIMTYALCGFANFGSLGILIGGLSTMVPERRSEIVRLGGKSLVAGTLATCMTGAVIGILV
jgi:concentrative nucleoside transporter, CNT family